MSDLKPAGSALALVGALCLVLVQFLPWGSVTQSGFGEFKAEATTWRFEVSGSGFGFSGSDKTGWYSDDMKDDDGDMPDGVTQIRVAIPFLLAGLVFVLLGGILGLVRAGGAGALTLVGALLAGVGVVLFAIGVDGVLDGEQDWGAAFYLGIAGSALALVGSVLALASGSRQAAA